MFPWCLASILLPDLPGNLSLHPTESTAEHDAAVSWSNQERSNQALTAGAASMSASWPNVTSPGHAKGTPALEGHSVIQCTAKSYPLQWWLVQLGHLKKPTSKIPWPMAAAEAPHLRAPFFEAENLFFAVHGGHSFHHGTHRHFGCWRQRRPLQARSRSRWDPWQEAVGRSTSRKVLKLFQFKLI